MKNSKGMVHHQDGNVKTHIWLTPPEIVTALGPFDLDPASHPDRPWPTAQTHFTENDNGLLREWFGRVWLNPPYDTHSIDAWMEKMAMHNKGTSLLFARTDRNTFHNYVFPVADSIFYFKQRLHFYDLQGRRAPHNGGAPSVLIAYGERDSDAIADAGFKGFHNYLNHVSVLVVGFDQSWRVVIKTVLVKLNEASVDQVYIEVEAMVPAKVRGNANYKAKIRQMLQQHGKRIRRGVYTI
jgi:hypothetical protein